MKKFNYALIRYMPNPIRGEVINIGLLVFNDHLDIRLLKSASKLRIIDNDSTFDVLHDFKKFLLEMYEWNKDIKKFKEMIGCFPSGITISDVAMFYIDHINQYESKVSSLFDALVKPYGASNHTVKHQTRLISSLKKKFKSINILAADESELSEHKVVYNYLLNESTGLAADFLLKNGIYHLTAVIDYDVADTKSKFKETSLKLMTFAEGQKSLEGEVASYFVYSASARVENEVIQQINLAESYSDKIFNMASKNDAAEYFRIVENAVGSSFPLMH
ncbi:DUF3037 domain-containing protein [Plesiomonas shigelloides]|uniref:DUF3037 domain-containing protein n=1 Tax=Plesiomonas shigelloides TaxID=703 RepID=UPI0022482746|nr:DUF3037 domain-containing protein [Plesiomonas shigelloides]MCX2499447.1 DUF3037 domain-containing protein [Plesiomonas shigelloides]